ncbi:hypothetical protein NC652_023300 [Populus alba x Populus x berolinensis]|nr:hypothetical protein NC652_023300 [Populus alba x Populus x berolinensis]
MNLMSAFTPPRKVFNNQCWAYT